MANCVNAAYHSYASEICYSFQLSFATSEIFSFVVCFQLFNKQWFNSFSQYTYEFQQKWHKSRGIFRPTLKYLRSIENRDSVLQAHKIHNESYLEFFEHDSRQKKNQQN